MMKFKVTLEENDIYDLGIRYAWRKTKYSIGYWFTLILLILSLISLIYNGGHWRNIYIFILVILCTLVINGCFMGIQYFKFYRLSQIVRSIGVGVGYTIDENVIYVSCRLFQYAINRGDIKKIIRSTKGLVVILRDKRYILFPEKAIEGACSLKDIENVLNTYIRNAQKGERALYKSTNQPTNMCLSPNEIIDEEKEYEFECIIKKKHHMQFQMKHYYSSGWGIGTTLVGVLVFCLAIVTTAQGYADIGPWVGGIAFTVIAPLMIMYNIEKTYEKQGQDLLVKYILKDSGFNIEVAQSIVTLYWSEVDKLMEMKDLLVVCAGRNRGYLLPSIDMNSQGINLEEIKQFIEKKTSKTF